MAAQMLAKKAGKSMFAKHIASIEPQDALYEHVVDDRSGASKRVRRQLPPGLSKRDAKILMKIRKRAHYLDKGISLCGVMRVGWTFWIGLIPFAGDIIDALLNYTLVVRPAKKTEIPGWLLSQMLTNNGISVAVGMVPLVGDVILGVWKANSRNAHLLEEYLAIRGQEYLASVSSHPHATHDSTEASAVKSQYKPGAGMVPGEIIPIPGVTPVQPQKKGFFSGLTGGASASNHATASGSGVAPLPPAKLSAQAPPALPARH